MTTNEIRTAIEKRSTRSAWARGVKAYAMELLDELEEAITHGYFDEDDMEAPILLRKQLLNGADNWHHYSWGGCSLIYDGDIASRLCTPSELKRTKNGSKAPNSREDWLDVQARALYQACRIILSEARTLTK